MTRSDVHPDDMFEHDPDLAAFARELRAAAGSGAPPTVGPVLAADSALICLALCDNV